MKNKTKSNFKCDIKEIPLEHTRTKDSVDKVIYTRIEFPSNDWSRSPIVVNSERIVKEYYEEQRDQ